MSFTYMVSAADWGRIAPIVILAGVALLVLMADLLLTQPGKGVRGSKAGRPQGSRLQTPLQMQNVVALVAGDRAFLVLPSLSLLGLVGAFVATIILFRV